MSRHPSRDPFFSGPTESNADLRKSVFSLMVEAGIGARKVTRLAAVLSHKTGHKISRNNLSMAITGYRQTPVYSAYLAVLRSHLRSCLKKGIDPFTLYTNNTETQWNNDEGKVMEEDPDYFAIETDRLVEQYALRIPETTKEKINALGLEGKKKLNREIMLTIARVLHEQSFDPGKYLKS